MTIGSETTVSGPFTLNGVTTTFAYGFKILDDAEIEFVKIATSDGAISILTPDSVTGVGVSGGGNVVFNSAPSGGTGYVRRKSTMTQATTLTDVGPFQPSVVMQMVDRAVMHVLEVREEVYRSIRGAIGEEIDPLPPAAFRQSKVFTFDADGAPDLSIARVDVETVAGLASEIANLDSLAAEIAALYAIRTDIAAVENIAANVTSVAGIAANVTTVAGIASNVTTVAGAVSNIATVAGIASAVSILGPIAAAISTVSSVASNVTTLAAVASEVAALGPIAAAISGVHAIAGNISTVAGIAADVSTVADMATNIQTVVDFEGDFEALAQAVETALAGGLLPGNNLSDLGSVSTARNNLGLGTAALAAIGTSGDALGKLNAANTISALQTIEVAGLPLTLINTTDAAANQGLRVESFRATQANNDSVYQSFYTKNLSGTRREIARLTARATTLTNGAEVCELGFGVISGGTLATRFEMLATVIRPVSNDGGGLGDATHAFSDLDLASGALIRFNNSYTVTHNHSQQSLAFSGSLFVGNATATIYGELLNVSRTDNDEVFAVYSSQGSRTTALMILGSETSNGANFMALAVRGQSGAQRGGIRGDGAIELGAASDTTIERVSAGVASIEGNNIITADRTASDTQTGIIELAVQSEMEAATDVARAVTAGRQHFHPGHGKSYMQFHLNSTTAIDEDYDIASVTDHGTGDTTATFSTAYATTFYAHSGGGNVFELEDGGAASTAPAVGSNRFSSLNSAHARADVTRHGVHWFGDK